MEVYVMIEEDPCNASNEVFVFENENDALQCACDEIISRMSYLSMDDEDDEDGFQAYTDINDYINNNDLRSAVNLFNDYISNIDYDSQRYFWVQKKTVKAAKGTTANKTYINQIYNYAPAKKVLNYPNGMNCCKCGDHNQYAEPNQEDDTYKCYKCEHGSLI